MSSKRVCICGGGNIAHAIAAVTSEKDEVTVFTRNPSGWSSTLEYQIGDEKAVRTVKLRATANLEDVARADYVFVALPRFAICDLLSRIDAVLHSGQVVILLPAPAGMENIVEEFSRRGIFTVGVQRVPHVARIMEYGHRVWLGKVRTISRVAFSEEDIAESIVAYVEDRFGGRVERLASFLSFTFSNSNPLLHPSRLVALLHGGRDGAYDRCPYFYAEWTDESSEYYVKADAEMYAAFRAYSEEAAAADYESALAHYESTTPHEMTRKMVSIESLKPILAPWKQCEDGLWCPDYSSRYFTEDVPFGTCIIQKYARQVGVPTPTIDMFIDVIKGV